ncbi:MAG TPA: glycosyl transferase [Cytophagales bacterium]|nr:glycosyl transferase [Cytophagales bacterium]HAA20338.1 glycosyl transferase [Cytophagales bacterium]HAP65287.1 glycosyl transferase [Cytophagales bacterium]
MQNLLIVGSLTLVSSFILTYYLRTWLQKGGLMDVPNARSSHSRPIPRGGGLAIIVSMILGLVIWRLLDPNLALPSRWFFVAWGAVALISFLDDRGHLPAGIRFGVHALAAVIVIWDQGGLAQFPIPEPLNISMGWLGYPLAFIWMIAVLNFFNFMDGINGYAGTQALLAGLFFAWIDPSGVGGVLGILVALGALGFLYFNAGKASIFMGDVGSVSLGFLFAALPFYLSTGSSPDNVYLAVLILWFFLADAAFTLFRRVARGEKIWQAHREHYFQQLVRSGWSHSRVVLLVMGAAALLFASSYLFLRSYSGWGWLPLVLALVSMFGYWRLVRWVKRKTNDTTGS